MKIRDKLNEYYSSNPQIPFFRRPNLVHILGQGFLVKVGEGGGTTRDGTNIPPNSYHLSLDTTDAIGLCLTIMQIQIKSFASNNIFYNFDLIIDKILWLLGRKKFLKTIDIFLNSLFFPRSALIIEGKIMLDSSGTCLVDGAVAAGDEVGIVAGIWSDAALAAMIMRGVLQNRKRGGAPGGQSWNGPPRAPKGTRR